MSPITPAITRWHFVRHAPVIGATSLLYKSNDEPADVGDRHAFKGLAGLLPGDAVWVTSDLKRAVQTADAMAAAGLAAADRSTDPRLREQDFGDWHGQDLDALWRASAPFGRHKFWMTTAAAKPPGGESFHDVIDRVTAAVDQLTDRHAGRSIVAVCHGGTIRAALARALGLDADVALSISVENLSTTRLDHMAGDGRGGDWRLVYVNLRPAGSPGR